MLSVTEYLNYLLGGGFDAGAVVALAVLVGGLDAGALVVLAVLVGGLDAGALVVLVGASVLLFFLASGAPVFLPSSASAFAAGGVCPPCNAFEAICGDGLFAGMSTSSRDALGAV